MNSNYELFGREHDKGWNKLVDKLITELNKISEDWEITQCKEKFGGLRFYAHGLNEEQDELVRVAEKESYTICEICGGKGKLRDNLPWIRTLCDKHYQQTIDDWDEKRRRYVEKRNEEEKTF